MDLLLRIMYYYYKYMDYCIVILLSIMNYDYYLKSGTNIATEKQMITIEWTFIDSFRHKITNLKRKISVHKHWITEFQNKQKKWTCFNETERSYIMK